MARLIARRELSPVELVDAHLERIEALNPYAERVRFRRRGRRPPAGARGGRGGAARRTRSDRCTASRSASRARSPSRGCPGRPAARSAAASAASATPRSSARARAAGAIVLGVTNVAEQLMAWETDNALYGRTNSPWDLARTPGGSSGGESAAIAAGLSAGGRRQRRRRLDPRPRALHRHLRAEAHAGPRAGHRALPAVRRPLRAHRRRRTDGAHGGRCRAAARR